MHSQWLLIIMGLIILLPGLAGTFVAFRPGQVSTVTRAAAFFAIGYVASGGLAFALASAHVLWPTTYLVGWVVMTTLLWFAAARRLPLREQVRGLRDEITGSGHTLALVIGAAVVIAVVGIHLPYLHYVGASRDVYYLNGLQIANAHGIPSATLEYGRSWPPATDKVLLDAFTAVVAMIGHNVATGPGVLDLLATAGTALGLWATAWELGLPRTSALLPLVMLGNWRIIPGVGITTLFWEYRAEDFGQAVAFCAIALGIYAFRRRDFGPAIATGLVLAAGSGTHLIPVVAAVVALCFAAAAEMLRHLLPPLRPRFLAAAGARRTDAGRVGRALAFAGADIRAGSGGEEDGGAAAITGATVHAQTRAASATGGVTPPSRREPGERGGTVLSDGSPDPPGHDTDRAGGDGGGPMPPPIVLRQGAIMAGLLGLLFVVIRLVGGGSFGLAGASDQALYSSVHVPFDSTAYLFEGSFLPHLPATGHWYSLTKVVTSMLMIGVHALRISTIGVVFAVALLVAVVVLLFGSGPIRVSGFVGFGLAASMIAIAVGFDLHYRVFVPATFGTRRLPEFTSLGLLVVALAVIEALMATVSRLRLLRVGLLPAALVVSMSIWVLPASVGWSVSERVSASRVEFFDWVRQDTSCGARFLANQRTEGAFAAATGRFALTEGMAPFLRPRKVGYVVHLMLSARRFFEHPRSNEAFLRQHHISYVVIARGVVVLGYPGPTGTTNYAQMSRTRFLDQVYEGPHFTVYKVVGATPAPVSPLLTGPYLQCGTSPLHY